MGAFVMDIVGYRGISFPFRVGIRGGVEMSTTSITNGQHIAESIQQILMTMKYERSMEKEIYSEIDTDIFEPNDESTLTLLKFQIEKALTALEPRIEINSIDIYTEDSNIYANISFRISLYNELYTEKIRVGEYYGS